MLRVTLHRNPAPPTEGGAPREPWESVAPSDHTVAELWSK